MMKMKRKKIVREVLEARLEKYSRRMQAISGEAYKIRQQIEYLDSLPKQVPLTKEGREKLEKERQQAAEPGTLPVVFPNALGLTEEEIKTAKEKENALHKDGSESLPGTGGTDQDAGKPELPDNPTPDPVLEKQPTELPSNQ
jgi:hypothetical protein